MPLGMVTTIVTASTIIIGISQRKRIGNTIEETSLRLTIGRSNHNVRSIRVPIIRRVEIRMGISATEVLRVKCRTRANIYT